MATFFSVAMFVFVLVAGNAIKEVLGLLASGRMGWSDFLFLMAVLIPRVIPLAMPLGMLTGVLLVLGRLSAQGEILAMKAAGISLYRIAAPIILIALGGTVFALVVAFYYGPMADTLYRNTLTNIVRDNPLRFFQPKTFVKEFPGYVFYFEEMSGNEVHRLYTWKLGDDGKVSAFMKSNTAAITYDDATDSIVLRPHEAAAELRNTRDGQLKTKFTAIFEEWQIRFPLDGVFGGKSSEKKLSYMNLNELLGRRQYLIDNPDDLPEEILPHRINQVQLTFQKKAAMAFSVLSLCAIAIPLGIKASRSETYANLAIAVALWLLYFFLMVMISWIEKHPALRPDLLIWLPNLLYQGLGFYLISRVNRH